MENLREQEHNVAEYFETDNIFTLGLLEYTNLTPFYIVGLSILMFIFSILGKISLSKKIYKCYKVISRNEIDYQIEQITAFLQTFYRYNECSRELSHKMARKLEKVDKAVMLKAMGGSYAYWASKETIGKKGKVFEGDLAQFKSMMV
jgi:hypothetical protein